MKRIYSGAASGKGAVYEWAGKGKAGQGRMEIVEASPSKITIKLDFLKPFEAHHFAEFTLEGNGGATDITWAMYGVQHYFCKVMSIFISMDRMVGKEFEAGLANLKSIVENQAEVWEPGSTTEATVVHADVNCEQRSEA